MNPAVTVTGRMPDSNQGSGGYGARFPNLTLTVLNKAFDENQPRDGARSTELEHGAERRS